MSIASCTRAVVAALALLSLVSPAVASESPAAAPSSVRADTADMKRLIADGTMRSAAFRALVNAINQSNLIVYVQCRLFPQSELWGRLGLVSATSGHRFAVIEIACYQPHGSRLAILAHELQHAMEVASAPWVVDAKTFDRLYALTGDLVRHDPWSTAYETAAAVESAQRVMRELQSTDKTHTRAADY